MAMSHAVEPSLALRAVLAAARVIEVDEGGGFCASVYRRIGCVPVARLDRSIDGAPHEGRVLRWTMTHAMGGEPGYFEYTQQEDGAPEPSWYRQ